VVPAKAAAVLQMKILRKAMGRKRRQNPITDRKGSLPAADPRKEPMGCAVDREKLHRHPRQGPEGLTRDSCCDKRQ